MTDYISNSHFVVGVNFNLDSISVLNIGKIKIGERGVQYASVLWRIGVLSRALCGLPDFRARREFSLPSNRVSRSPLIRGSRLLNFRPVDLRSYRSKGQNRRNLEFRPQNVAECCVGVFSGIPTLFILECYDLGFTGVTCQLFSYKKFKTFFGVFYVFFNVLINKNYFLRWR